MALILPIECKTCKFSGITKPQTPHNTFLLIILLILGVIPGVIYYLACMGKYMPPCCPRCKSHNVEATGEPLPRKITKVEIFIVLGIVLFFILIKTQS